MERDSNLIPRHVSTTYFWSFPSIENLVEFFIGKKLIGFFNLLNRHPDFARKMSNTLVQSALKATLLL